MSEYAVLGKRMPRVDGPVKAAGTARFTDDLSLPGILHGKILRSPHAHARILRIDTTRAEKHPGVRAVIVGEDFGDYRYGLRADTRDEYPLARGKVRYLGEEVAAVAAVDEDTALEALELIRVDYEVLPAVTDPEEALREGAPQLHDDKPGNISVHMKTAFGDVDEAFRQADYIREAMDESRSKRQILVLDCCNSGAFSQGTKAEVGASMGMMTAFQGYGRYVLTASDATQYAWEGDRIIGQTENSLFTHFLVKGLEGEADNDGDGRITVDDLYHYAFEEISQLTPSQTPTKSASKQAGEIVLRQITRIEDTKPVSLPDDLIEAIQDERPFVREGAVHQLEKLLMGKNLGRARSAKDALEGMAAQDDSFRVRQAAGRALAPFHQAEERAQQERKAKDEAELASAQRAQPARSESEQESSAEIEANQLAAEKQAAEIKRKADLAAQQKTALAAIEAGHWQIAQGLLKGLLEDDPGNSEALELMRRVEAEIRGANEQRLRQDQIAALYKQAHGFIRARQWGDALKALDEIRGLDERFVDKDRLADKANDELHHEAQATQRQALLAALYGGAVRAVEEGRYQDALDSWQRIESIDPNYRDSSRVRSIASRGLAEHAPPPARARRWALLEGVNPTWWIVLGAIGFGLSRLLDIDTIHGTIPAETWLALRGMVDGAIAALLLQGMLRVWNWKSKSRPPSVMAR